VAGHIERLREAISGYQVSYHYSPASSVVDGRTRCLNSNQSTVKSPISQYDYPLLSIGWLATDPFPSRRSIRS
jgi:hypothetical protein